MTQAEIPISQVPLVDDSDATAEVAALYDECRTMFQIPFIPTLFKAIANSPVALAGLLAFLREFFLASTLPVALRSMILYTIARAHECEYCSVVHQATCRMVGIDEESLRLLTEDLSALEPQRVQVIVDFALKCAMAPKTLGEADFERLREQGVTDEELAEIVMLAGWGNLLDTLADGLKLDASPLFTGLPQG